MDRSGKIDIVNLANVHQTPEMHTLSLSLDELEKGGFPHFMLKEIWEQPNALRTCIKGRLHKKTHDVVLSGIIDHKDKFITPAASSSAPAVPVGTRPLSASTSSRRQPRYPSRWSTPRSSATATPSSIRTM